MKKNTILNYFQRSTPASKDKTKSSPSPASNAGQKRPRSLGASGDGDIEESPAKLKKKEVHFDLKSKLESSASPAKMPELSTPKKDDSLCEDSSLSSGIFPHLSFEFLQPDEIKDKDGRRPDDPDYDCTTLHVPSKFLEKQTPAHRQWWEMKSENFDTMLFFKMGKFYELFHMDAVIAMKECNLLLMKKDYAHCGFPEIGFERHANILVDRGFKIARIEQVETPKMMEERCRKMNRPTKFDKVVRRKICEKVSSGTRTFGSDQDDILVAICDDKKLSEPTVGICVLNTSLCKLYVGDFVDDSQLTKTHTLLTLVGKAEILYSKSNSSAAMQKLLLTLPSVRKSIMKMPDVMEILEDVRTGDYFCEDKENMECPAILSGILDPGTAVDDNSNNNLFISCKFFSSSFRGFRN